MFVGRNQEYLFLIIHILFKLNHNQVFYQKDVKAFINVT